MNAKEVRNLYNRNAHFYDPALSVYRLVGVDRQRRRVVEQLGLAKGDTVIDLGCGTGANFAALVDAVGPLGNIVGVDLSPEMLVQARQKVEANRWRNVQLCKADLRSYEFPETVNGVVATFALEMVPEYDDLIETIARVLPLGSRLGIVGMKLPERWPNWLVDVAIYFNRPFGVSREYCEFRPWRAVDRHMTTIEFRQLYFGAAYRCIGQRNN